MQYKYLYVKTPISPFRGGGVLFIRHPYYRNDHFLQAYTAVLEGIAVIIGKVIIVIGITQVQVAFGKDERRIYIRNRQPGFSRVTECQYVLCVIVQVAAMLVAQVSRGLLISDHFHRRIYPHTSMVSSHHHG